MPANSRWDLIRRLRVNKSQLQPPVKPPHIHPVITSHYTTQSPLENVVRLVSFITGEVVQHTYAHAQLCNRTFIHKKKGSHYICNLEGNESFSARLLGWFLKHIQHTSDKKMELPWERRNSCSKAFGITRCYNTPTSLNHAARRQMFKSCSACTIKIT